MVRINILDRTTQAKEARGPVLVKYCKAKLEDTGSLRVFGVTDGIATGEQVLRAESSYDDRRWEENETRQAT